MVLNGTEEEMKTQREAIDQQRLDAKQVRLARVRGSGVEI